VTLDMRVADDRDRVSRIDRRQQSARTLQAPQERSMLPEPEPGERFTHLMKLLDLASHGQRLNGPDTAAHVERVLEDVGWNVLEPDDLARTTRADGEVIRLELRIGRVPRAAIMVYPLGSGISSHQALPVRAAEPFERLIMTDGLTWWIWRGVVGSRIERLETRDAAARERILRHLDRRYQAVRDHPSDDPEMMIENFQEIWARAREQAEILMRRMQEKGIELRLDGSLARFLGAAPAETGENTGQSGPASGRGGRELPRPEEWPPEATHRLRRKGCISYIRYEPATRKATLLPGSIMPAQIKASCPAFPRKLRTDAIAAGFVLATENHLRVVTDLVLDTPSTAATVVTGTAENGWMLWRDREGKPIARSPEDVRPRARTSGGKVTRKVRRR
jgi:hypothetical protein